MIRFNEFRGQVNAVDITDVPAKMRPAQWDELAEQLSAALGGDWRVAKIAGGFWKIFDSADPTRGSHGVRKSFETALGEATGLATVRTV